MTTDQQKPEKPRRGEPDVDVILDRLSTALAAIVDEKLSPLRAQVDAAVRAIGDVQARLAGVPDLGAAAASMQGALRELTNSLRILLPTNVIALRPEDVRQLAEHAPGTQLVVAEEFRTPTVRWQKGHRVTAGDPFVKMYINKLRLTLAQTDDSGASAAEVRRIIEAETRTLVDREKNAAAEALAAEAAAAEQRAAELKAAAQTLATPNAA